MAVSGNRIIFVSAISLRVLAVLWQKYGSECFKPRSSRVFNRQPCHNYCLNPVPQRDQGVGYESQVQLSIDEASLSSLLQVTHQGRRILVLRLLENFSKARIMRCLREYFEAQSRVRPVAFQHLVEEFACTLQGVLVLAKSGV